MVSKKNMEKYATYKSMMENLSKAMRSEFYYQAIFIEYAILEDRATSALKYAHVKYLNKNGQEIAISKKLNKLRDNSAFSSPFVRKGLTVELIEQLLEWTQKRNQLVHSLAKIPYNHKSLKEIAEQGQDLVRTFSNKVKSINRYHQKKFQSEIMETTEQTQFLI